MALLHLLLECQKRRAFTLHALHINHNWREESARQAEELRRSVEALGLCLAIEHLVPPSAQEGNLEAKARTERLQLFAKHLHAKGCQALVLAHHADDQAETVLKRVLEGASLCSLRGLRSVSLLQGMVVWRPLLAHAKGELAHWLQARGLRGLQDPCNADVRFLRARMREQLLPALERTFGKRVRGSLVRLGQVTAELEEYLEERIAASSAGATWSHLHPFERKMLLRRAFRVHGITLSANQVDVLARLVDAPSVTKRMRCGGREVQVGCGRIYLSDAQNGVELLPKLSTPMV